MGAAAVAAVTVVAISLVNGTFPGQHSIRGSVQNVDGSLYAISDDQVRVIPAGYQIRNGDQIRTAKGSNAVVRLLDGSLVEMAERSDLSVSREWRAPRSTSMAATLSSRRQSSEQAAFTLRPPIAWYR